MSSKLTWVAIIGFASGIVIGWLAAGWWPGTDAAPEPDDWLARVGDQYLTVDQFENEMRRRGGRSGQYHDPEMRRALLDQLLLNRALVQQAQDRGIQHQPEVRRSLDQILTSRVIQTELRPRQQQIEIDESEIETFYSDHAGEYTIPSRRRVAMLFFELGEGASAETREQVIERAERVRAEALELDAQPRDFGTLAREHSDHQASRYRGGVLGWIGDGDPARYSYPEVVIETARSLTEPGDVSEIVSDENGLYLVRLVDHEPRRARSLDELADGIRQRLLRERHIEVEQAFQEEMLAMADIEIRDDALERVTPPGPQPRPREEKTPPAMPAEPNQGSSN